MPAPFYPGLLLMVGVLMAAWQNRRQLVLENPPLDVLALKEEQYRKLAERGMYGVKSPDLKDDPLFADKRIPAWNSLPISTRETILKWQKDWNQVSDYWANVLSGKAPTGAPPTDPWGVGQIARKQVEEQLRQELAALRTPLLDLAANPDRLEELLPQLKLISGRIEHLKGVLPSEITEHAVADVLGGDRSSLTGLVLALKERQYVELAEQGRFDDLTPQFGSSETYRAFSILWGAIDQNAVEQRQQAWQKAAQYWGAVFKGQQPAGAEPSSLPMVNVLARDRLVGEYVAALSSAWEKAGQGGADPRTDRKLLTWAEVLGQGHPQVHMGAVVNELNGSVLDAVRKREQALTKLGGSGLTAGVALALLSDLRAPESAKETASLAAQQFGVVTLAPKQVNLAEQMRGPLLELVHQKWVAKAAGRSFDDSDLALLMVDVRVPEEVRTAMGVLNDAYGKYWSAVEGRYQAVLQIDETAVTKYSAEVEAAHAQAAGYGGLRASSIGVLKDKYEQAVSALAEQAKKVADQPSDDQYARLRAMLNAAKDRKWSEIATVASSGGDKWGAFWRWDRWEKGLAETVVTFLQKYAGDMKLPVTTKSEETAKKAPQTGDVNVDGWTWPAESLKLGGSSAEEVWLTKAIENLNKSLIPSAARLIERNKTIAAMKKAGNPPTAPVPPPPLSDPAVQDNIANLTWDQSKVDKVWERAKEVGVDPRVMLAVVIQEGTGSFNTNADVPVQFWKEEGYYAQGGSGAQPDFKKDLDAALDSHILAKLRGYGYYAKDFREAAQAAGLGDGNVFQYANYSVPWFRKGSWTVSPGCYATHTEWWKSVSSNFDSLAGKGKTAEYSLHLVDHPIKVDAEPPKAEFYKANDGTGSTELIQHQPWIRARGK